jgi:mannose-6-phosphate isomerase-like protein (cupin superfamily)
MSNYPHTIDNGHGERLTFTGVTHTPDGDRLEAEGLAQPGAGAPMHVHHLQEEALRVVSGRLGYQVPGEAPRFAGPGELVVWPAGTAHKWWNAGDRPGGAGRPTTSSSFSAPSLRQRRRTEDGQGSLMPRSC